MSPDGGLRSPPPAALVTIAEETKQDTADPAAAQEQPQNEQKKKGKVQSDAMADESAKAVAAQAATPRAPTDGAPVQDASSQVVDEKVSQDGTSSNDDHATHRGEKADALENGQQPTGDTQEDFGVRPEDLFCDQYGDEYVRLSLSYPVPHYRVFKLNSQSFLKNLKAKIRRNTGRLPPKKKLAQAFEDWEAIANMNEPRELSNRFASSGNALWIDMADKLSQAIKVTSDNWVIETPPPLFRRFTHQRALVTPQLGGQAKDLFGFLPPMTADYQLLCLAWTVLACMPSIARPMLLLAGEHGAAKTTMCRFIRTLWDPSTIPLLGEDPRGDPTLTLFQHALPAFDNISTFSRRQSDFFCRAVTGAGSPRRKLYTDDGEVILAFRRAILINALAPPSVRADFLDRSLIVEVKRLGKHLPEEALNAEFELALPKILGGMLDILAGAMRLAPTMTCPEGFRMADFVRWGRAVAVASGSSIEQFDTAYQRAVLRQAEVIIEEDPVGIAVLEYMEQRQDVTVEGNVLFPALHEIIEKKRQTGQAWSKQDSSIPKRILELIPCFARLGLVVKHLPRTNKTRSRWHLTWKKPLRTPPPKGSGPPSDAVVAGDAELPKTE